MKLPTLPLLLLLPLLSLPLPSTALSNRALCAAKNHNLISAINKFCSHPALTVPSIYAKHGVKGADKHSHIWIDGEACEPAEWVPSEYCRSQFWGICAGGGKHGGGWERFGRGRCQVWWVGYHRHV
ncbi:hypothetical protein B0A50_06509 [Salinomyces thailandicus]|uniref:Uncharacterized protein n=1 Tax=Salinomyces thailandicus TaxID=706561 RepID=A0A4U0TNS1_9PEZI|nr:hypothetical protein B0A50_06509 [Salinomyces thailandica]